MAVWAVGGSAARRKAGGTLTPAANLVVVACDVVNEKRFITDAPSGFERKLARLWQTCRVRTIRNRRRVPSAKHLWADCEVQLIHQTGAQECAMQFPAALAQKTFHLPSFSEPAKRSAEVDFALSTNLYFGEFTKDSKATFVRALGREYDDRREFVFEDFSVRINRP